MALKSIIRPLAPAMDVAEARLHVRQDSTADDAKLGALVAAASEFAETETWRSIISTRWQQIHDQFPSYSFAGTPQAAIMLERSPLILLVGVEYLNMAGQWITLPATEYTVDDSGPVPRIAPVFGKVWPPALPQMGSVRITYDAGYAAPLTADQSTDTLTLKGWKPLAVGDAVRLSNSGGALPTPLKEDTDYYVTTVPAAGSYKLANTPGGAAIDLTDSGSGTSYIGVVPEGLKSWMLLRLDSLYAHRGEMANVDGIIQKLPYVDRLLDPYRVML